MEHLEPYMYCRLGWRCVDEEVLGRVRSLLAISPALPPVRVVVVVVVAAAEVALTAAEVVMDAVSPSQMGVARD